MRMLSPLDNVFNDFDRVMDSFMAPRYIATPTTDTTSYVPNCDVTEEKDHFMLSFDMPGVKKEDIKIEVQENHLTVTGERRRDDNYRKFERSFTLPNSVDYEKIEARYENGVLDIALPKAETAKARTIQIQSGQSGLFSKLLGTGKKDSARELKDVKVS